MAPFAWQSNQAIVFCFSQKLCFQDLIQCRILKPNSASIIKEQSVQFSRTVVTPWAAVPQASLSITNAQSLLKLMSIESVMLSNHLILCQIHSKKSCALHEISLIIFPENRILKFSNWTDEIVIPSVFRMFITMLPC